MFREAGRAMGQGLARRCCSRFCTSVPIFQDGISSSRKYAAQAAIYPQADALSHTWELLGKFIHCKGDSSQVTFILIGFGPFAL